MKNSRFIPNQIQVPEIFKRHVGSWKGECIQLDTLGQFLCRSSCICIITIDGIEYRQINHYEYADGQRLQLNFTGVFEGGTLKLFSSSYSNFSAIAWDAGQETLGFRATATQDNAIIQFVDTITLLDPDHRVRSTQIFKNGIFDGISFIKETRLMP